MKGVKAEDPPAETSVNGHRTEGEKLNEKMTKRIKGNGIKLTGYLSRGKASSAVSVVKTRHCCWKNGKGPKVRRYFRMSSTLLESLVHSNSQ